MSVSQNFPEVRPTLNLNFARSKTLDPRITFTRASTGTYVDSDGLIKIAAADEARFDHDPATGESLGLLIEEQRTNLFTNSNPWSGGTGVTWVANQTSPTGGTEAYKMQETTSNSIHGVSIHTGGYTANYNETFSVFAKAAGNRYLSFWGQLGTYPGIDAPECIFDLQNGVVAQNNDAGSAGLFTNGTPASIQNYGNGWYRCTVHVNPSALANRTIYLLMGNSSANDSMSFAGNGSNGILLFGLQREQGSFPTSYIPTSGSTVTRVADVASITGTNFSSWYNSTEGSFYVKEDSSNNALDKYYIFVSDGANNDRLWLLKDSINRHVFRVYESANTLQVVSTSPTLPTSFEQVSSQFVGAYFSGDSNSALNGSIVGAATNNTFVRSGSNSAYLGSSPSGNFLNGHLSRLTYWSERLTDTHLQNLTK